MCLFHLRLGYPPLFGGYMKHKIHDLRIRFRRRGKKKDGLFIGMQY